LSEVLIESNIEVIGANALRDSKVPAVNFQSAARLREIAAGAFAKCTELKAVNVPEPVEIIGPQCFEGCFGMGTIEFEAASRLERIGDRALAGCPLCLIIIPASTREIDGSAFVDCDLPSIRVASENENSRIEGNWLVTFDGTEILRYFGMDPEVKVFVKSCMEGCKHLGGIDFEKGSELEQIDPAALRNYASLLEIVIPASSVTSFTEVNLDLDFISHVSLWNWHSR
jgi:hypothetical protein